MTIPHDIRWLFRQLRPLAGCYIWATLLNLLVGALSVLDPLLVRWIIDDILPTREPMWLAGAASCVLILACSRLALNRFGTMLLFKGTLVAGLKMRLSVLRHLNKQSADYYDRARVGDLVVRVEEDVSTVGDVIQEVITTVLRTLVYSLLAVVVLTALNARFTFLILPLIPAFILIRRRYVVDLQARSREVRETRGRRGAFLQELFSGIVQVQLLCRERTEARKFSGFETAALRAQNRRKQRELTYNFSSMLPVMIASSLLLGYGGYQVMTGAFTVGGLVACFSYLSKVFEPLAAAVTVDTAVHRMRASLRRILEVFEERPHIEDPPAGVILGTQTPPTLDFDNVSFGYEPGRQTIKGVTFRVRPGERVALAGRSGSGKSTLAKLAARLYDVQRGAIRIGGEDIRNIRLNSLRSVVAFLPQDPVLLSGTIRENVLYGNPTATQQHLEQAAAIAHIDGMIWGLPMQWDQDIGSRATMLSGGEHQRVALARTLLREPQVLILDECTSALDGPTEKAILEALDRHAGGVTVIIISHRTSTMRWADRVILLDRGQIIGEGTHDELQETSAAYQHICREYMRREAVPGCAEEDACGASRDVA
jgi:ABC-type multidrug transport system fused ATPase/permease subunit